MNFKNLKVLCVIKGDRIYTRVVRQDPVEFAHREDWGSLKIKSLNSTELRCEENTLFVRGNRESAHHSYDRSWSYPEEIALIKLEIEQANKYYKSHYELPFQNPNS